MFQGTSQREFFSTEKKWHSPCCARWHRASSMWRLIGAASLLAFCTIHGSAPSSIRRDLPLFNPVVGQHNVKY